jgi:hypothetical protein
MQCGLGMKQSRSSPSPGELGQTARPIVVTYSSSLPSVDQRGHEWFTCTGIAKRLAALKCCDFAGHHDASVDYPGRLYLVPNETLVGLGIARLLGIQGEHNVFGGVVPQPFVATKAISHGLIDPGALAPEGWSHEFCDAVRHGTLTGYSVFSLADAHQAGAALLKSGPVRLKAVRETGGRGQIVLTDRSGLDAALATLDPEDLIRHGLVLEENLSNVITYSVGQVRVGVCVATYYGTQRLTLDNSRLPVYGGSDLTIVRGGFDALLAIDLPPAVQLAISQARLYDGAASTYFPGLIASRRNYDVAQGVDAQGRPRSGVLEQSWRLGGASGAEIAALEAFAMDPGVHVVKASTVELFGEGPEPPTHATVYFRGIDPKIGPMTKFTLVEPHVHER